MSKSDPRYPIGTFELPKTVTTKKRAELINQLDLTPATLYEAVTGLSEQQLDHPYRDGGWTVRQVVHHLPDSHLNGYTRFKLAVTEEQPTIKVYDEAAWAEQYDAIRGEIGTSLLLLETLHRRWVMFLRALAPAQFQRAFKHPVLGLVTLDQATALYAWHGRHHVAHITALRKRLGW